MADNGSTRIPRYPFTRSNAPVEPSARGSANDPLTELARLIGQHDPFPAPAPEVARPEPRAPFPDQEPDPIPESVRRDLRAILAGHRSDSWQSPPPPAEYDDQPLVAPDHEAYPPPPVDIFPHLDTLRVPPPPYEPPTEYGHARPDGPLYGDNGQLISGDAYTNEQYAPEHYPAEPLPVEDAPARARKGLFAVIAVFGLAVVGTMGAYAYRTMFSGMAPGSPPLIRADSSPNKVAATQSGDSGASKQIYDRLRGDQAQNEKVVSREEQPVDVRAAQSRPAVPASPGQTTSAAGANGVSALPAASGWPSPAGAAATPNAGGSPGTEPRKIRTIPIRSDQLASAPPAAESQAAAPPPAQVARPQPSRPAAPPREAAATSPGGPLSLNPQGGAVEARSQSRARSAAVAPQAAEAAASGAYVVQLAAHKSQEEASAAFRSAQAKYPDVLGGRKMLIRKKEVLDKGTFYGAQVGPFASREDAIRLCENLKSAGGTCIVQRN